ncbi:hypothetical protein [Nocardioides sp. 1609]|uniref:hypothetical protein n=1 Tax=Nocardioides sp. 1609 TaxID=2508327 RepID=UPI0010705693|nr:hypothetical protein [Nocardioides sp. 1609]
MTDEPARPARPETREERRRRLEAIFGDTLPDTTSDERDAGAGSPREESASDAWLKSQVPPHHG